MKLATFWTLLLAISAFVSCISTGLHWAPTALIGFLLFFSFWAVEELLHLVGDLTDICQELSNRLAELEEPDPDDEV